MPQSINYFIRPILSLPRYVKQILAILCDISLCIIATWLAFYLRLDQFIIIQGNISWAAIISIVIAIPVFWLTGIYKTMFRYSGKSVIVTITFAIIIYGLLYFSVISVYSLAGIPRSIGILQTLVLFFLISGSRLVVRYLLGGNQQSKLDNSNLPRALVYGAGNAGIQ